MRECLGWLTNCADEQSCPQNWLELSVSELPLKIACHVCQREVHLVVTEGELSSRALEKKLTAYPVVPPIALSGQARPSPGPSAAPEPQNGANRGAGAAPVVQPPLSRPPTLEPVQATTWTVTLGSGERIVIDKDTMIIGRSRTCEVVIASAKISRQHASITRVGGDIFVEDLGSANGVWLRGEKITRVKVTSGDAFNISDEILLFEER